MHGPARSVALAAIAGFGHIIYPLYLARRTRDTPTPIPPSVDQWPAISVVIPAFLEAGVIEAKVEDVVSNGYPGAVEVIVAADDEDTAAAARLTSATVLESDSRRGKAAGLNRGIAAAAHDLVVISDANTTLAPRSLENLVRWFDDPTIAAVAGEKRVSGDRESLYWKFESWLKQREFMTGTTIGLVGELAAVRKDAWRDLPEDVTNDDLWTALDLAARQARVAYEPQAAATEDELPLEDEWQRRTRVVAGGLDVLWRRRDELVPGSSPVTDQIWGHRLIRMTAGPLAHAALLRHSLRSAHRSKAARAFLGAHLFAGRALYRQRNGEELTAAERAGAQALWLQLVAFGGMWRFARREATALWPKRDRSTSP